MRTIRYTARFRKDYKREKAGRHARQLDLELESVVAALQTDEPMPRHRFDHPLKGEWSDCRDCHVRPDLVLIYRKPDAETLELVRLGSHGQLGF